MTSIRFRNEVTEEASNAGVDTGDCLILYADLKALLASKADDFEEMLDAVATAYEEEKKEEIGEIGTRVIGAVDDSAVKIFKHLTDHSNPFEDDDEIYPQKFAAAAVLDFLIGISVIQLSEAEDDSSQPSEQDDSAGSESE